MASTPKFGFYKGPFKKTLNQCDCHSPDWTLAREILVQDEKCYQSLLFKQLELG
jgi:hypothetical protein